MSRTLPPVRALAPGSAAAGRELFRALLERGSDVVLVMTPDGILHNASPSVERLLGHSPQALRGRRGLDFIHPDEHPQCRQTLVDAAQRTDGAVRARFRVLRGDGSHRWVEAVGTNLLDEATVRGIAITVRDITEQCQAEDRLRDLLDLDAHEARPTGACSSRASTRTMMRACATPGVTISRAAPPTLRSSTATAPATAAGAGS